VRRLLALVAALPLAGCATTIVASERDARIFVNGRYVGTGTAEARATGFPGTFPVQAETPDGRSARVEVHRSLGPGGFLLGFFTYGICFFACWTPPDVVYVRLPPAALPADRWRSPSGDEDPWLRPPGALPPRPAADPWGSPPPAPPAPPRPAAPPAPQG
jgi:hypothetical protein